MNNKNEFIMDEEVLIGLVSSVPATEEGLDSLVYSIISKCGKECTNPYIVEE